MFFSSLPLNLSRIFILNIRPRSVQTCQGLGLHRWLCHVNNKRVSTVIHSQKSICHKLLLNPSSVCYVDVRSSTNYNKNKRKILERLVYTTPSHIKPYLKLARIDRPTGTMLLLWPCYWSIAMASEMGNWPSLYHLLLFGVGAFFMRGAGCTINDMWDKDLDSKVDRTKDRPIANGDIEQSDALAFLAFQLGLASLVLLQLNWYCIVLGASSLSLVITYPLAKRFTNWPQLVLGFVFNWGALLGWAAIHGSCDWTILLPLYTAGISWTLLYDTIYALQDKVDDAKVGIKSTALLFGNSTKQWLAGFSCSMVGNLLLAGQLSGQTWPYYSSIGIISLHLAHQVLTLKPEVMEDCAKKFRSNNSLGLILFLGIVLGVFYKDSQLEETRPNNS